MARILITGSTDGLGLAAARSLIGDGHDVVVHARTPERARAATAPGAAAVVVGDLADAEQVRGLAAQVDALGPMDAIIHNAGVYSVPQRTATREGHPLALAVNTLAPFLLTALVARPSRLVFLSSSMHRHGEASLGDVGWTTRPWDGVQAYCDTKLLLTTLAFALARRWPDVLSNAVDPGWVPTRMGGPQAPDDLVLGSDTQIWLAAGTSAQARVSGAYWHHREHRRPLAVTQDEAFQDAVVDHLTDLTGVALPTAPVPSSEHLGGPP